MPQKHYQPFANQTDTSSFPKCDFVAPVISTRVAYENLANSSLANYAAQLYGTYFPDQTSATGLPGYRLVQQIQIDWETVARVYAADPLAQDTYNFNIQYAEEDKQYPIFIRDYLVRRSEYNPSGNSPALLTTLTGVIRARVTAAGTGYDETTTVTGSGGSGSGATYAAIVFGGALVGVAITDEGTGYTSAPTLTVAGPAGSSGATAQAFIQTINAKLVHEEVIRNVQDPRDGLYVIVRRIYESLPGPVICDYSEELETQNPIQSCRQVVPSTQANPEFDSPFHSIVVRGLNAAKKLLIDSLFNNGDLPDDITTLENVKYPVPALLFGATGQMLEATNGVTIIAINYDLRSAYTKTVLCTVVRSYHETNVGADELYTILPVDQRYDGIFFNVFANNALSDAYPDTYGFELTFTTGTDNPLYPDVTETYDSVASSPSLSAFFGAGTIRIESECTQWKFNLWRKVNVYVDVDDLVAG